MGAWLPIAGGRQPTADRTEMTEFAGENGSVRPELGQRRRFRRSEKELLQFRIKL